MFYSTENVFNTVHLRLFSTFLISERAEFFVQNKQYLCIAIIRRLNLQLEKTAPKNFMKFIWL